MSDVEHEEGAGRIDTEEIARVVAQAQESRPFSLFGMSKRELMIVGSVVAALGGGGSASVSALLPNSAKVTALEAQLVELRASTAAQADRIDNLEKLLEALHPRRKGR